MLLVVGCWLKQAFGQGNLFLSLRSISNHTGDRSMSGSGVVRKSNKARYLSSFVSHNFFTVCTALSTSALPFGQCSDMWCAVVFPKFLELATAKLRAVI